jgi:serine-type D-Ala-D-Ala carboxypeptidase/endopeptidase (penicillin-binding protein 4)
MGNKLYKYVPGICCLLMLLQSCSVSKQIDKQAHKILLQDTVIHTGHIGISIYEPATHRYWYNYNAEKYFVPASNVKLFTLYAGMKYLGDSLVGLRYTENNSINIDSTVPVTGLVKVFPTGDPTFLNAEFRSQPVFDFLKKLKRFEVCDFNRVEPLGNGWAWDDYMEPYMTPRSSFPVYKNMLTLKYIGKDSIDVQPRYFKKDISFLSAPDTGFSVSRDFFSNKIKLTAGTERLKKIPVYNAPVSEMLKDTLKNQLILESSWLLKKEDIKRKYKIIHSQPSDSLFKPMMHNSDNFFAEQTLLMASNEKLGYMNDEDIIDTLLRTDLKDIPQQPGWVDGSGLSRYNLFTPQSFVYILNKMQNEFGLQRLKIILPTGGEGTLKNYYNSDSSFIYAKTGSLSNQIALSGFLITQKNKLLVFSLLTNNAIGDGWRVRRAYEAFLKAVREKY